MAGTVVTTEETFSTIKKITFAWTSSAGGAADATTVASFTGAIERLVTVPDGVDVPTDNYDVAINDDDGTDVLIGAGQNRSSSSTQQVLASSLGVVANDKLTLAVTNAGNAKKGKVYLYIA